MKLEKDQLRSFIRRAQSRSPKIGKDSPLGPFNLKNIEERYANDRGSFREAHPHRYQPLQDLGIGVSHLKLQEVHTIIYTEITVPNDEDSQDTNHKRFL